ncbi:hypothetical protein EVAR_75789_1 [Eumeta japonica]|uniref:Uncharacterized protein n=1 Tax=Eumeta variegata TaxID=151549 RepID=A0A4C1TG17_EUMVA|nr:hypothetical protein EVAR_75789_1 [Eumeta japonica]
MEISVKYAVIPRFDGKGRYRVEYVPMRDARAGGAGPAVSCLLANRKGASRSIQLFSSNLERPPWRCADEAHGTTARDIVIDISESHKQPSHAVTTVTTRRSHPPMTLFLSTST